MNKLKKFLVLVLFFLTSYTVTIPEAEPIFEPRGDGEIYVGDQRVDPEKLNPEQLEEIQDRRMSWEDQQALAEKLGQQGDISLIKPGDAGPINILTGELVEVPVGMDPSVASGTDWNALAIKQARAQEASQSPVTEVIDPLSQLNDPASGQATPADSSAESAPLIAADSIPTYQPEDWVSQTMYDADGKPHFNPDYEEAMVGLYENPWRDPALDRPAVESLTNAVSSSVLEAWGVVDARQVPNQIAQANVLSTIAGKLDLYSKSPSPELLKNMVEWLDVSGSLLGESRFSGQKEMIESYLQGFSGKSKDQFVKEMQDSLYSELQTMRNDLAQSRQVLESAINEAISKGLDSDKEQFSEHKAELEKQLESLDLLSVKLDQSLAPKSLGAKIADFFGGLKLKITGLFKSKPSPLPELTVTNAVDRINDAATKLTASRSVTVSEPFTTPADQATKLIEVTKALEALDTVMIDVSRLKAEFEEAGFVVKGDEVHTSLNDVLRDAKNEQQRLEKAYANAFDINLYTVDLMVNGQQKSYTATDLMNQAKTAYDAALKSKNMADIVELSRLQNTLQDVVATIRADGIPDAKIPDLLATLSKIKKAVDSSANALASKVTSNLTSISFESANAQSLLLGLLRADLPQVDMSSTLVSRIKTLENSVLQAAGYKPGDAQSFVLAKNKLDQAIKNYNEAKAFTDNAIQGRETLDKEYQQALADYTTLAQLKQQGMDVNDKVAALLESTKSLSDSLSQKMASFDVKSLLQSVPEVQNADYGAAVKGVRKDLVEVDSFYTGMEGKILGLKQGLAQLLQ